MSSLRAQMSLLQSMLEGEDISKEAIEEGKADMKKKLENTTLLIVYTYY